MVTADLPPASVTALVTAFQVIGSTRLEADSKVVAVTEVDQEMSIPRNVGVIERDGGGPTIVAIDQVIRSLAAEEW